MIHIISGGTIQHIRPHLALCAPAFGGTGRHLMRLFGETAARQAVVAMLHQTAMAGGDKSLCTNEDVEALIGRLLGDPLTKAILMPVALCDYKPLCIYGPYGEKMPIGLDQPRLKTRLDKVIDIKFGSAEKILSKIKSQRPDVFLGCWKTTSNQTDDVLYEAATRLLKDTQADWVFGNDIANRTNILINGNTVQWGPRDYLLQILAKEVIDATS